MRELPSGTVTLLFTDIEGSTRLLHELGDEYAAVLVEHRRLLRDVFTRHGGVEVDTQGDAFFFAFPRAGDAVAAAGQAQCELAAGPVRVRMGIHTGAPIVTEEGYVGTDVHRAARIMSAGHGGQVVLSDATQRLLDHTSELRDLGEHRLKDLSAPQRLYQLGDAAFPSLKTLYRANLPIQPTPLVGRVRELEEAGALLRSQRLVTLTGPGGSGKTRLALQLAAEALEYFPDGVYWVPLQALRDPALVHGAIAASVGAEGDLFEHVGDKSLLVLLDNFEQIVEAAPTVSSLLAATPNAQVLVTSREPLRLDSEQRYAVEPLPEARRGGALRRACARRRSGLHADADRRRDLPAGSTVSRSRSSSPPPALPFSIRRSCSAGWISGCRYSPRSHATLPLDSERYGRPSSGATTSSSRLSRSSSAGSPFSAEASRSKPRRTVCEARLDALESLVVKSLVRRWGTGRLGMLDTIREYAVDLLEASPDAVELRRQHAEHFLSVAVAANLDAAELRPGGQQVVARVRGAGQLPRRARLGHQQRRDRARPRDRDRTRAALGHPRSD